jgi:hypothetical protein
VEGLRSTDGGKTWEIIGGWPFLKASAIVIDPTNPRTLYAANTELHEGYDNTKQMWVPQAAITKSEDGGQTWTVVFTDQPVCGLALAPNDPQILYATIKRINNGSDNDCFRFGPQCGDDERAQN